MVLRGQRRCDHCGNIYSFERLHRVGYCSRACNQAAYKLRKVLKNRSK